MTLGSDEFASGPSRIPVRQKVAATPESPETRLSRNLRDAAIRRDHEWGWPPNLIPRVIDEAEALGLLSLGGQLQFILPAGICECYWVDVDPLQNEPARLDWEARVRFAAENARSQFEALQRRFDFIAEGRKAFATYLDDFEMKGGDLDEITCFIWYLDAQAVSSASR